METQAEGEPQVLRWIGELQRQTRVEINSRKIFDRYYGWVRGFFRRRLSPERAEDLAQETLFQALRGIASFRGGGTFESWLFAIAANLLRNERRRLLRQKRAASEVPIEASSAETGVDLVDAVDSPEAATFQRERLRALDRAVSRLPEKPRLCIRLRLAGYDYPEIAELLEMSPSTARVHVFTARKRLHDEFGEEFGEWVG
jgi:RNA polymerase sigma-70 factor (ECF subfamily)